MKISRTLAPLLIGLLFIVGCSNVDKKPEQRPKSHAERIHDDTGEPTQPYHTPDRGLGTLDYSKETRDEMNQKRKQSQDVAEQADH